MKILYLSLRFPYPPHSGDKIRTYNILKHLSKNHSITLISFIHSDNENENIKKLYDFCERVLTVRFSKFEAYRNCIIFSSFPEPFQISYWRSHEMQNKIDEMVQKDNFEIIHAQFFRMAQYIIKYTNKHKVLDCADSYWLNLSRRSRLDRSLSWPLLKVEANRVRIYETKIAEWFDRVTMVSHLDKECLLSENGNLPVSVVPMGVDLDYYQPNRQEEQELNILFTGTIKYFPNKDAILFFYNKIYPLIKSAIPNVKFYVVGNYPPRSIKRLLSNGDIVVTGHVEDVRPYFDRSAVFVCPLRSGSGMQAKILEAMAMGVPVVTTSMGATAIVDAVAGKDILIANNVKSFAKEVIRLLKDKDLRCNIAQNARKLVEEKYNWGFIVNDINEMYQSITGRSNSPY